MSGHTHVSEEGYVSGGIYLVQNDGGLVEMIVQNYASEDRLQELLADYPNLLAGDQIDSSNPRRWLLVSREVSLASEEDRTGRWSVDHLFLDQDGIPTIVEVKRSSDTRIRREVVGQMLDYAAHAVVYWPLEALRSTFKEGREEPEQDLMDFLEAPEADPEDFWQKVRTNLQAGKVRLIFVADEIPPELRRIVEFLNQQMDPAEVLAVEIKQYVSQTSELTTLIPRVVGQTAEAQQKKSSTSSGRVRSDEESFFKELEARQGADTVAAVRRIQHWAIDDKLPRFEWRRSRQHEMFYPCLDHNDVPYFPLKIRTDGKVEVIFRWLNTRVPKKPPFDDEEKRLELLWRLNEIPGVDISEARINGIPTFPLSALRDEAALNQFLGVLDWFVQEVRES
jgi:hypothetical protein